MGQSPLINLAAFALQVCAIGAAASLLLGVLRIGSAGARYACWRVALVACLIMPLLLQRAAAPVPVQDQRTLSGVDTALVGSAIAGVAQGSAIPSADTSTPLTWEWIVAVLIAAGGTARAAWLTAGLVRLRILRRRGVPVLDDEYVEMQSTLGTTATLLTVEGLAQPATFGLWRPVVLLPETLAGAPAGLRRAVVTHELFHVQRRDWLAVLVEESLRTVFWFHPAIFWITSRIQLAREELVDELTVLATGNRKAYIEALLAFADAGGVRPAPAFARRRHLFTRILRLSKERAMSSRRIVVSSAVVIAAVLGTGWYAGLAFPIVSAAPSVAPPVAPQVAPPAPPVRIDAEARQQLGVLRPSATRVAAAQGPRSGGAPRPGPVTAVAPGAPGTKPVTPENPIPRRLSSVTVSYPAQLRGTGLRATAVFRITLDASGSVSDVQRLSLESIGSANADAMGAFLTAASDAIRQWRYQPPADPPIAFFVTVRFNGEGDAISTQSERAEGVGGRGGVSVALASPDVLRDQLVLGEGRLQFLRAQRADLLTRYNSSHPDVVRLEREILEMEREIERATELQRRAEFAKLEASRVGIATGGQAEKPTVRVGGNVPPPTKIRHVDPAYPEIAKSARVQGVVILETLIDREGRVESARVLRSIPLLDQAALDAVRQWEFTPTLLNGSPVAVIMTITVQFTLPPQ